jgi:hypothetical protein
LIIKIQSGIIRDLDNLFGWRTKRKIVVIESDDWGSIRLPSREVYETLISRGIKINNLIYNRYDSLACEEDLSYLFETLNIIKDKSGNSPVFTANTIVANPDFDKIRNSNYNEYFFEPFTETLKRYPKHTNSFKLWKEGITARVFKPQFHGREHLNVSRWLKALQANDKDVHLAFNLGMFDLSVEQRITEHSYMDALNFETKQEIALLKQSISEGLDLFYSIFGYRSQSFIAPSFIWPAEIEGTLYQKDVRFMQSAHYQLEPLSGIDNLFKKRFHYTGQLSKGGLKFIVRNASFEPSERPDYDWTDEVLAKAKSAFLWGKPLVISSHRVNYIGFINPSNRDKNLPKLSLLLKALLKKWQDIEFLSTDELGALIT